MPRSSLAALSLSSYRSSDRTTPTLWLLGRTLRAPSPTATSGCAQQLQTASHASFYVWGVSLFREPDAGNLPVRFDEREQGTELRQTGLRRIVRKHPNSHREAKATAPVLDSTRHRANYRPIRKISVGWNRCLTPTIRRPCGDSFDSVVTCP